MNSRSVHVTIPIIVGVALLLVVVQTLFAIFYTRYAPIVLTRGDDWSPYFFVEHYLGLIWASIVIVESVLLLIYWNYRYPGVLSSQFSFRAARSIALSGMTAAVVLFSLAYPLGWPIDNVNLFMRPIVTEYTSGGSILTMIVFLLVLPVSLELVFRGIIFVGLREVVPEGMLGKSLAVVGSAVLFAYCWPFFGYAPTFFWGVGNAVLLTRTNSLWSSAIANVFLTIFAGMAVVNRI